MVEKKARSVLKCKELTTIARLHNQIHALEVALNYIVLASIVVQCHYIFNKIVNDDFSRKKLTYLQLANPSPQIQEQHKVSQVLSY